MPDKVEEKEEGEKERERLSENQCLNKIKYKLKLNK